MTNIELDKHIGRSKVITYVGLSQYGPHVVYLSNGLRITVGRDERTKGPAWLEISETPTVQTQQKEPK